MTIELLIENNNKLYEPITQEGIIWTTERQGVPGQLTFKVVKDSILDFTEGNVVRLRIDNKDVFYGFVFKKKRNKDNIIDVTAYDQLRYLKNKDVCDFKNKRAGQIIQIIAKNCNLQTGSIANTGYVIPSRLENNTTYFDMIQNALDLTMQNRGKLYVMYDDFGKITLKSLESMKINLLIDSETGENFDYESSIDGNTYNKIRLIYDNDKTGETKEYGAGSIDSINQWGVLQYFDTLKEGENGKAKAQALLDLYNSKTRTLSIRNAFGDLRVRAGSVLPVILDIGDIKVNQYMLVEKCKHTFKNDEHFMELNLRGGEFIA